MAESVSQKKKKKKRKKKMIAWSAYTTHEPLDTLHGEGVNSSRFLVRSVMRNNVVFIFEHVC